MAVAHYDFHIEQGSSFRLSLIYKDDNGNPVDITGWSARLKWLTDKGLKQVFTTDNYDHSVYKFVLGGDDGRLTLLIPSSTTDRFNFSNAVYDLELESNSEYYEHGGKYKIRLLYGNVNLIKQKTKSQPLLDHT